MVFSVTSSLATLQPHSALIFCQPLVHVASNMLALNLFLFFLLLNQGSLVYKSMQQNLVNQTAAESLRPLLLYL